MKLLGYRASHTPGFLALKLCPNFLTFLEKPPLLIAVTGTNGKTTTSNLLAGLFRQLGLEVVNNDFGSNIKEGIITSLLEASSFFGRSKVQHCILEIDERTSRIIFPELVPDYLIVTNIFRESYLRNAHGEFIFNLLNEHIPVSTKLLLNCDDPLVFQLSPNNERIFFSIDKLKEEVHQEKGLINDLPLCPQCNYPLDYKFRRYHHLGKVSCPSCDFTNPQTQYLLVDDRDGFHIKNRGIVESYPLLGENILDHYAQLSALSLMRELGFGQKELTRAFLELEIIKSRKDIRKIGQKTIYKMLAKGMNPVAISRAISIVTSWEGEKAIILLNDTSKKRKSHEENTAWIYDTDFEILNRDDVKQILIGGYRAQDYLLRLTFAGIPKEKITIREEKQELAELVNPQVDLVAILHELYSEDVAQKIAAKLIERFEADSVS